MDKGRAGNGRATPRWGEKPAAALEAILPQISQLATAVTPIADKRDTWKLRMTGKPSEGPLLATQAFNKWS